MASKHELIGQKHRRSIYAPSTKVFNPYSTEEGWFGANMDWQGQKLSEMLMQIMLLVSAVLAFVAGYVMSSFQNMLIIYAASVGVTMLTTVPDWPFFNRNPLQWLDPKEAEIHGVRVQKPKPQPQNTSKKSSKASKK